MSVDIDKLTSEEFYKNLRKEGLTISIRVQKYLVEIVDELVDLGLFSSRSEAFRFCVIFTLTKMNDLIKRIKEKRNGSIN